MRIHVRAAVAVIGLVAAGAASARAQTPPNLVANPRADLGTEQWQTEGAAQVTSIGGNPRFTARWGGAFSQVVQLPDGADGRYVALTALATAERLDEYAGITDRPYLHGLPIAADGRVLGAFQGQQMSGSSSAPDGGGAVPAVGCLPPSGRRRPAARAARYRRSARLTL